MGLGQKVREMRTALGLSQEHLAHRAGVSLNAVHKLEAGRITDPHFSTLSGIARALDTTVAELVGEEVPVPLGKAAEETGRLEEERLEANFPKDQQHWERLLASVHERQSGVEAKVGELVALSDPSKADLYQVKRALDEAQDCWVTLMLALPGSHRRHRRGRDVIAIENLLAVDPDQWEELGKAERFYDNIIERLVEAGLVELRERIGQRAEPVPVGIGA
jgi:transcriptional regulator with XRE-family HTH domain